MKTCWYLRTRPSMGPSVCSPHIFSIVSFLLLELRITKMSLTSSVNHFYKYVYCLHLPAKSWAQGSLRKIINVYWLWQAKAASHHFLHLWHIQLSRMKLLLWCIRRTCAQGKGWGGGGECLNLEASRVIRSSVNELNLFVSCCFFSLQKNLHSSTSSTCSNLVTKCKQRSVVYICQALITLIWNSQKDLKAG